MTRSTRSGPGATDEDNALLAKLSAFLAANKTLTTRISWVADGPDLRFACTLDIDGVTVTGITLFGRATASLPDRKVTLGLHWQDEAGRGGNFERLEWRPLKAHINRPNAPRHVRLRVIEGSHYHPLSLNAQLDVGWVQAMQENLPVAEKLDPDPPDWPALLRLAADFWRIDGMFDAPQPPWQYGFLPLPPAGKRSRRRA